MFLLFFSAFFSEEALAKNGWPACPENGEDVTVYVESSNGNLRYHPRFNAQRLKQLGQRNVSRLGGAWVPMGLTVADENYQLGVQTAIYQLGQGRYCAVLKSANLFIGYKNIDVFITDKYARGSCQFESIMEHEKQHVSIFRDTLYRHSQTIEQALHKYAPRIGPVYQRSQDAAKNHISQLLEAKIRPLFDRMSRELNLKNSRIDTRANYRREQSKCPNW